MIQYHRITKKNIKLAYNLYLQRALNTTNFSGMRLQPILTKYIILIILTALNYDYAISQDYNEVILNDVTLDLTLSTNLNTLQKGKLKNLISRFYFIPHTDSRQDVISIDYYSIPKADSIDALKSKYYWKDLHDNYAVWYNSKIKTSFKQYPIENSPFPVIHIPDSFKNYVSFDDIIDQNRRIKELTLSLIKDETELFPAVFNIGKWIYENIKYVKVGYEIVEKASVVYKTRFGDCDELSILFLSMLRIANIPSRLILGVAKGNTKFDFHAWVEVYFDNIGWVPFDATFGQFGYIDQGHIKLKQHYTNTGIFLHAWEYYTYYGNVEIKADILPKISAKITNLEKNNICPIEINIHPYKSEIGINAYLPAVVTSWNRTPYYVSNKLFIREIEGIDIIGGTQFLLDYAPFEKKKVKLLLKMKNTKNTKFKYSSSLMATDQFGTEDSTSITFHPWGKRLSIEHANAILDSLSWTPPVQVF